MTQFARLFEPGRIGDMEVRNRLVMAPMVTSSTQDGHATPHLIDYYVERAKGGVGLIITQGTSVSADAPGGKNFLALYDDSFIPSSRQICDAVHEFGARIATQLGHHGIQHAEPGRRAGMEQEIPVLAPSAVPYIPTGLVPRELTVGEIKKIVEDFAEAARRARDAHFDAVEIHGAHGRLVSQFLSPFYNKRNDEYGGSIDKRARFACEIIERTRQKVGLGYPILIRINGEDGYYAGVKIEHAMRYAQLLEEAGADAIDVSVAASEFCQYLSPSYLHPYGVITHLAADIKKGVRIPVITVGKIVDPFMAERLLEQGKADFVALGRALFADPRWAVKAKEGRQDEIVRCIYCLNCRTPFARSHTPGRGVCCTVNPSLHRERDFAIKPAATPKMVMVIGGGLAGMEAARTLAQRGHRVHLYEKADKLGGQWNIACLQPEKKDFASLTRRLTKGLEDSGVTVALNHAVTCRFVEENKPDVVILATGAVPATLNVPGADGPIVVQANDVIVGTAKVGDDVAVIGGRYLGMEIALSLAEQGKKARLITRSRVGRDVDHYIRLTLMERLLANHVSLHPFSKVLEITDEGVAFVTSYPVAGESHPGQTQSLQNELTFLQADTIVLAVGTRAENSLAKELKGICPQVYCIGDCVEPRHGLAAMAEAAEIGRAI